MAKTPKNYIQEYCQYILRSVILIWSHIKAFICQATCWNINVRSTEDWHVGKLTIVFTDIRKRTSFTVIETAETRTGCPEMDFKRTVGYVDWTKLGDHGAIIEPPHLVNLHTWSTFTPGQLPHLVNLHTWSTFTPGQLPHLVNLHTWLTSTPGQPSHLVNLQTWSTSTPGQPSQPGPTSVLHHHW